jgi:hypothetical protein
VLAQRLKELADAGVVQIEAKPKGKGHIGPRRRKAMSVRIPLLR